MEKPRSTRRSFLSAVAIAGASSAAGSVAAAAPGGGWKKALKIGMVQSPGSLTAKFALVKKLGFNGVELISPDGPDVEQVVLAKSSSGLAVHGVMNTAHWRFPLSHPDPDLRDRGVTALKQAISDARSYGGDSVLLVPGKVDRTATYEECWKRSQTEIKRVLELAARHKVKVLIENAWNNFLKDPAEAAKYIDQLKSPWVGACLDIGNAARFAPPEKWIAALGRRIVKVDIRDYDLKVGKEKGWYRGFQVKLLEGSCDWKLIRAALRKVEFTGWLTAEMPGGDEDRLREISRRMDGALRNG